MNLWQWQMHGSLVYCYTQLVMKCHLPDVQFGMVFVDLVTNNNAEFKFADIHDQL